MRFIKSSSANIFLRASMIALYRPYLLREVMGAPAVNGELWQYLAHQRVKDATTNTQAIVDKIVAMDFLRLIGPMT